LIDPQAEMQQRKNGRNKAKKEAQICVLSGFLKGFDQWEGGREGFFQRK
jgi:hypothetical protein